MATTKEKCLVKPDDRLKKTDFREKLRSMPALKKNETEKKRGPLIAKPTLLFTQTSSVAIQHTNDIPSNRGTRTPSPPQSSESAFTRQVVHNYRSFSPGPPSRRTRSPSYTRSSSPTSPSARRRTPSPTGFDAAFQEEIKKRVQKVLRARLYLLQQIGPNSFMIGGDSPMHKFRVIIGPQTCSCGHGPHCVHLLFVMLRVFQVGETDQRLWNRILKNYEVESLFNNYHARRNVRMKYNNSYKDSKHHSSAPASPTGSIGSKSELSNKDDEEICPICLLEMLDGESLVTCEVGCHNKLHHHCIAVWAEECQRQNEPIICPLCRAEWGKHKDSSLEINKRHSQSLSSRSQGSSESILGENDIVLPHSDPIPREHLAIAIPWTQIFGEEVVACLFSRDWIARETALRYLSKEVIKALATVSRSNSICSIQQNRAQDVLCHCCSILAYMAGDPVYKVFIASLKCLRNMLACVPCQNDQDLSRLQENFRPFVKTILLKCADGNRRTSQLSVSTLIELCRGQRGELAIGRETCCAWQDGIGGVGYLLSCIIENYNSNSVSWQWLLGRLCAIDKLMGEFPRDFCLLYIQGRQSNSSQVSVNDKDNLVNYERLVSLLNFSVGAINNQHTTVSKMARRVFVLVARRATHIPSVFSEFCDKLSILESSLQHRIRRRLRAIAQEFLDAASTPTSNKTEIYNSNLPWLHTKENQKCINNKLNSSEFFHDHVSKSYKHFKMNNLKSTHNVSLTSPSTPEHHFQRSLSVPTISSFHFQNIEKLGEVDLIDFSDPLEKHNSHSFFGKIEKPCPIKKETVLKEEKPKPPKSLNVSLNFFDTSMIDDLSELSDLTMSFTCEDRLFTFKSEVTTPKSSPSRQPSKGLLHLCKEELEEEEAIALALAMDTSRQEALPHIPGLSSEDSNEVITIHLQPEMGEHDCPHIYLENIHWVRGPLLGTGAFSSCYQVRDVKSGTLMAVKQVSFCRNSSDEQHRVTQAIKEEIVMMAKLNHPNVLRIMGATQQGGHFNMFVEWMPGGSVAGLLDKYGTFAESVIINYTQQVLRGLAYLHDNHILHRDLKGANLLVDSTGQRLRIADFGAAARLASHATGAGEFQGQLLGTIAFMAPEVLRGEDYGRNCDIWSVGCVMIEMATTKPPWNANDLSNHLALIFKIACSTGPPTIPEHLSPAARDLALRCLEQKPEDRPSAKELLKHPVFCISINGKFH